MTARERKQMEAALRTLEALLFDEDGSLWLEYENTTLAAAYYDLMRRLEEGV